MTTPSGGAAPPALSASVNGANGPRVTGPVGTPVLFRVVFSSRADLAQQFTLLTAAGTAISGTAGA